MKTNTKGHRVVTVASVSNHRRFAHRFLSMVLAGLCLLFAITPAFADQFYFSRTRALADPLQGATGLFLWNDATGAQSQIGGNGQVYLRHGTDGAMAVDGLATDQTGALYGFAIDDSSIAGFLPWNAGAACTATQRSRLVSIDASTAIISYVGPYLVGRNVAGAAFDSLDRLWALDCTTRELIQIDPATGSIMGSPIATAFASSTAIDIDFAANGLGIIGFGGLDFYVVDVDTGTVVNVPTQAQNNGFDGALVPPYGIGGLAFTNHLTARNGSPAAQACRLNLGELRGLDELGHANDPFFANPMIAYREAEQLNPPGAPNAGWFNGGPGDMARIGGPALPDCFYDWGDARTAYRHIARLEWTSASDRRRPLSWPCAAGLPSRRSARLRRPGDDPPSAPLTKTASSSRP